MKFLILKTTNPYRNLAIEEYLFSHTNDDIFMLWQNEPTVVIGKNQNAFAEVNIDYAREKGIHIARRITGGGAVYHDLGNVNYSFISSREKAEIDFEFYTRPIIKSLKNFGISAKLSGRNDLCIGEKKFSGNAEHTKNNRTLHHGTLLFNTDFSALSKVLTVDEEKLKAKAIKSTRSRVTNLSEHLPNRISVDDFIEAVAKSIIEEYSPTIIPTPENEIISTLEKRNNSKEYIFPERDFLSSYTIIRKKRFDFGTVCLYIDMKNEFISKIRISGDFFEIKGTRELEGKLKGKSIFEIQSLLQSISVGDYIFGMKNLDFLSLINE